MSPHVLAVEGLRVVRLAAAYPRRVVTVLQEVSFTLTEDDSFAVIGPSGSGKTTLALACAGLIRPAEGTVLQRGEPAHSRLRRGDGLLQMVFQDPFASFNPRRPVGVRLQQVWSRRRIAPPPGIQDPKDMLRTVGLPYDSAGKLPSELSGGECQRWAIICALAAGPSVLALDEPTAMLDPLSRKRVVDCVLSVRRAFSVAIILISQDPDLLRPLWTRGMVLDKGRVVDAGTADDLYRRPSSTLTRKLLDDRA